MRYKSESSQNQDGLESNHITSHVLGSSISQELPLSISRPVLLYIKKKNYDQKVKSLVNDDNEWEEGKWRG